uniref:Uncharacterized protein n=1 Tax=Triticum urartu TaxID=4572 RepID=A0A8R7UEW9_TRIUA
MFLTGVNYMNTERVKTEQCIDYSCCRQRNIYTSFLHGEHEAKTIQPSVC